MASRLWSLLLSLIVLIAATAVNAAGPQQTVETTWRLLDYLAVDYAGAVKDGRIVSASEYAEMREFSGTVTANLHSLRESPAKASLEARAKMLQGAIASKASPAKIAEIAHGLGADLLRAYPVPLAPRAAPDVSRGWALYQENCASCHGKTGQGNGPDSVGMDPPPVNFTDRSRASQRSVFGLYQVITQGLGGTEMKSFRDFPEQDRWALAFRVGTFAYQSSLAEEGKRLWQGDPALRKRIPDLKTLVSLTPQALGKDVGEDNAAAVMAYLRASPDALAQTNAGSLALTRSRLAASVAAYRRGDADEAKRLALSAYLDGFEPVEPVLATRDAALMHDIESGMGELRSAISNGDSADEVARRATVLDGLFSQAEVRLGAPSEGGISTFLSALTILLREGIEALLIVVAMLAFLRKSERQEVVPYVHGGWITALIAGLATWFAATEFISISGASRELTEGFGGIFAAVVLVSVGIWMHGKANAQAWQQYIHDRMNRALTKESAWFLFGLAFIVVYREAFETVLFYAAMWTDGAKAAVMAGVLAGAALLAGIAWAMIRYSVRLPITEFFRYSSMLIAILAVVLTGKGIAALQEAGWLGVSRVGGVPQIDVLGLHPTVQAIGAQVLVIAALIIGFRFGARAKPAPNA
jgi:high-affinity iron transporter